MRKVLIDANVYIRALNPAGDTTEVEHRDAKEVLAAVMSEPVTVIITPLIRHEVLRGIHRSELSKIERVKDILDGFTLVDITDEICEFATTLFRISREEAIKNKSTNRNPSKHNFDRIHVATAHKYDLDIVSSDTDIQRLQSLIINNPSDF